MRFLTETQPVRKKKGSVSDHPTATPARVRPVIVHASSACGTCSWHNLQRLPRGHLRALCARVMSH
jgi:hypothetical protein